MTTVEALSQAYRDGRTTPVEVAERFLAADPTGAPWHAFRAVDPQDVRAQAAASAERLAAGRPLGPLEGVPVGVKDFFAVRGYDTYAGTRDLSFHGEADALLVSRLRAAGALMVGKTHTTELGISPTGVNAARGTPINPHARGHLPGGSSSGTGAALAAGLIPLGVGSDGGGSIRIPAAMCGVFGHKPSWDLVPTHGEAPVGWWSIEHVGPMARCTADLVTMLDVMAETHLELPSRRLRIGVDWAWWGRPDPEVDAACRAVVAELAPTAVTVEHVELAPIAGVVTAISEVAAGVWDVWRDDASRFSPDVQAALASSAAVTGVDYVRAQQARRLLAQAFAAVFTEVDVLATPTTAVAAPPRPRAAELADGVVDLDLVEAVTAYTFPANLCGLPAASVPVGVTADGRPVGLQLVGPRGGDATVLAAAAALERADLAACATAPGSTDLLSPDRQPTRST